MPICPRCGKSLSSDQALTYHLNRKYKCGTWKCHKCFQSFDTKFALNIHSTSCNTERKYVTPSYDILLNIFLHSSTIIYVEIDNTNIIHNISPNCEDHLGYKQRELIGCNYSDYITKCENTVEWKSKHDKPVTMKYDTISDNLYAHYVL